MAGGIGRFAACFTDGRAQAQVEHPIETMVAQRVFGIALGYEDLIDHDELRHDPVLATLAGKLEAKRRNCAPLAGKSTLNRLEHAPLPARKFLSLRWTQRLLTMSSMPRLPFLWKPGRGSRRP